MWRVALEHTGSSDLLLSVEVGGAGGGGALGRPAAVGALRAGGRADALQVDELVVAEPQVHDGALDHHLELVVAPHDVCAEFVEM